MKKGKKQNAQRRAPAPAEGDAGQRWRLLHEFGPQLEVAWRAATESGIQNPVGFVLDLRDPVARGLAVAQNPAGEAGVQEVERGTGRGEVPVVSFAASQEKARELVLQVPMPNVALALGSEPPGMFSVVVVAAGGRLCAHMAVPDRPEQVASA